MKGEVVVIPFPFSDLSGTKRRPALVIADDGSDDVILCQITSRIRGDGSAVPLAAMDLSKGSLPVDSYIRPNKLFTADRRIVVAVAGKLNEAKYQEVIQRIVKLIS